MKRRAFISGAIALSGLGIPAFAEEEHEEDISPAEDLMREHGALNRMMLVYDSAINAISKNESFSKDAIQRTAKLIQSFVENYHERLEEEFLFPRFRKAGVLVSLVDTLEKQHKSGKELTKKVISFTQADDSFQKNKSDLVTAMSQFISMYRPHEAREDTVLFPALKSIIKEREYKELGEQFEEKEHKLFGDEGFSSIVEQIAEIEKKVGIYDLEQFTVTNS